MHEPRRAWFKPKTHGYGAYPASWEGWAIVLGYAVGVVVLAVLTFGREHTAPWIWGVFVVAVTVLTLGLLMVSRRRTEGDWRWRWGDKDQSNVPTNVKVKR
jgi:hypothetical protein